MKGYLKNLRGPKSLSVSRKSSSENIFFLDIQSKNANNKFNYLLSPNKKEDRYDSSPDSVVKEEDQSFEEIKKDLTHTKKFDKLKMVDLFQSKKVLQKIKSPSSKDFDYEQTANEKKSSKTQWQKFYKKILLKPKQVSLEEINLRINSTLNNYEPTKTKQIEPDNPYIVTDILEKERKKFVPKILNYLNNFQEDLRNEQIAITNRITKSNFGTSNMKKLSTKEKNVNNLKRRSSYRLKSSSNNFLGLNLKNSNKKENNFIVNLNPITERKEDIDNSELHMINNKSFNRNSHQVTHFSNSTNDINIKNIHSRVTSATSNQLPLSGNIKTNEIITNSSFNSNNKNMEENKNIQLLIPTTNNSENFKKNFSLFNYFFNFIIDTNINYPKYLSHYEKKSLSDIMFLKLLSNQNIPIDDVENIKHDIKAYEKELNNFKKNFKDNHLHMLEEFFHFDFLKEDLKQLSKKNINGEKVEQRRNFIDRIIKKINDLNLNNN